MKKTNQEYKNFLTDIEYRVLLFECFSMLKIMKREYPMQMGIGDDLTDLIERIDKVLKPGP